MSPAFLVCLVLCIGFGMEALRSHRIDRANQPRDQYHLYHGPKSGCTDCQDK